MSAISHLVQYLAENSVALKIEVGENVKARDGSKFGRSGDESCTRIHKSLHASLVRDIHVMESHHI